MTDPNLHLGGGTRQVIFESGGNTDGITLFYSAGNTLEFVASGTTTNKIFSTADISSFIGQNLDIVASIRVSGIEPDALSLHVNQQLVGYTSADLLGDDWAGGNGGAFGQRLFDSALGNTGVSFSSGTLTNFDYYFDTFVVVPEPTTALGVLGLVAGAFFRRRRRVMA